MNALAKFRYLGPCQTARKYLLKAEHAANRSKQPPALPPQDPSIDLRLTLLGHDFDLHAPNRWHGQWPFLYGPAVPLNAGGDVKLIWELNRHQFGPTRQMIRDWIAQNPYPFGINWNNAMEVALRMIAWMETFGRDQFADALAQHARFVRHNLSSDWIPRNNHLIAEAAALSIYDGQPHPWLRQAAVEQFYASGVHREHSVAYHHFVTHLFQIAGLPQPKALAYLGAIRQPDGSLPNIGDNDDGLASTRPLELPPAPSGSVAFPDAGHYVVRQGGDYCFVRCGEFGLPPNFSHGHADLLSPILWLRGKPVFIDAGTFTYNGDPTLRRHFRSAHAHNVPVVEDRDMAEQTGTFSWENPPRSVCENWSEREFVGSAGPWRRQIRYDEGRFTITDTVTAGRRLRWRFHLHPDLKVTRCADGEFVFGEFRLTAPGKLSVGAGWFSPSYGVRVPVDACEISMDTDSPVTAEFRLE